MAPVSVSFSADTIDTTGGRAQIALLGTLGAADLSVLREQVEAALSAGSDAITIDMTDLVYLDPQAVRYLALTKQHRDFVLEVTGAKGQVAQQLQDSELYQELATAGMRSARGSKGGRS
jgi:anti-anti-sigma regulatory factor